MPSDDYYSILNLQRDASDSDVKKAYHKMAMKWHPDKNPDDKERAERKFKEISEAYQVLSDKDKRAVYDRYGKEGLRGGPSADEPSYTGASGDRDFQRAWSDNARQRTRHHGHRTHTHTYNDGDSRPSFYFAFRTPEEVFAEFFGGRDPFEDLLDGFDAHFLDPFVRLDIGRGAVDNSRHQRYNRTKQPPRSDLLTRRSRNGDVIQDEIERVFGNGDFGFHDNHSWNAKFPERLNPASGQKFTSTTTSTKNGRRTVTRRVIENGVETVTVEENGVIKDRKVLRGPEII